MKYLNFAKHLPLVLGVMVLFAACKKAENFEPLADAGQKYIKIVDYGGTGGGFANASFASSASTSLVVDMQLELTTNLVSTTDITVTLAADPALVAAYNATKTAPADKYLVLPSTQYTFPATIVTIKAGQTMSNFFSITFNPSLIDGSKNYMIPIAIKTITGAPADVKAAPNTSVAYMHFVGNPLAGNYATEGYFYHPSSPRAFVRNTPLKAISPTALFTELGDLGAANYSAQINIPDPLNTTAIQNVTVTVYPGSTANPLLSWPAGLPSTNPGYTAAWPKSNLCNNTYNPFTKTFYLRFGYLGGTGFRVTEEVQVKY